MKRIIIAEKLRNEIARLNEIANYNFKDINEEEDDSFEGFNPENDNIGPNMILGLNDFGFFDEKDKKVNFEFIHPEQYVEYDIEDFDELLAKTNYRKFLWFSDDDSGRRRFDKYLDKYGGPYKLYIKKILIDSNL